jgi:energy-coupling factor transporter ATP-binding protein EcfA2
MANATDRRVVEPSDPGDLPTLDIRGPALQERAAISVRDLRKADGGREAVRGVSFDGAPGEVLGFLGPNGAGKTTTIEILEGYRARTPGPDWVEYLPRQVWGWDVTICAPVRGGQDAVLGGAMCAPYGTLGMGQPSTCPAYSGTPRFAVVARPDPSIWRAAAPRPKRAVVLRDRLRSAVGPVAMMSQVRANEVRARSVSSCTMRVEQSRLKGMEQRWRRSKCKV